MITSFTSLNISHIAVLHYEWENCNLSFHLLFVNFQPRWLAFSSICWSLIVSSLLNFNLGSMFSSRDWFLPPQPSNTINSRSLQTCLRGLAQWKVLNVLLLQAIPSLTAAGQGLSSGLSLQVLTLAADFSVRVYAYTYALKSGLRTLEIPPLPLVRIAVS